MDDTPQINLNAAKLVLLELQRQDDAFRAAVDTINGKAAALIQWASLAITVVSAISMDALLATGSTPRYWQAIELPEHVSPLVLLFLCLALYLLIILLALRAILPRPYEHPLGLDWDEMCDDYLLPGEQDATEQLLTQYRSILVRNTKKHEDRTAKLKLGLSVLPFLIVLLVFLAIHPVWSGLFP